MAAFNKLKGYLWDNFVDKKFPANKNKYYFQCLVATVVCLPILMTLSLVSNEVVIVSIASTSFLVFSSPHTERSKARYVLGGYLVGFVVGLFFYLLTLLADKFLPLPPSYLDELFGALAIGVSIFIMLVMDLEHPPASAVALALVINQWNIWTILVTFISLFVLLMAKYLLKNSMIELI